MASIGEPFTTDVPAVGTSGTGYATSVNAILDEIISRLEAQVPVGSIAPAEDPLDMNNQGVQSALYLGLYQQTSVPSGTPYGRLQRYGSNLYWVDSSGAVQITDGSGLNASGIGGIGGDYGGVNPAMLKFVDATETYEFYDDEPNTLWARTKARGLLLVDEASTRVVTVVPSGSIANSYTITLPTDLPAATGTGGNSLLVLTPAGQLQYSQDAAIAGDVTFDTDINLSAGRRLVHPARVVRWPAVKGIVSSGTAIEGVGGMQASGAGMTVYFPFPVQHLTGWRITATHARINRTGAGNAFLQLARYADGAETLISAADSSAGTGEITLAQSGLTESPVSTSNSVYYLKVIVPNANDVIQSVGFSFEVV